MAADRESTGVEIESQSETYSKLLEAAILKKNMDVLPRLLQDDPAILDRVKCECRGKDNPLHVGALHGNDDFVREILIRKPELTLELNSEGQSPLHLASARGHVKVVTEILRSDANANACFIRDCDGMIPLHLAAINGRVDVLKGLLEAVKITAFILTKSGEPILHLCAKNNKIHTLKKLTELVNNDPSFVNLSDRDGNTILHLLSAKGNAEVIKSMVKIPGVDVNAKNTDGFTPLDVAVANGSISSVFSIRRFLRGAGAKEGENISLSVAPLRIGKQIEGNDRSGFAESLMVVAVLTATVAFQARLNPPARVSHDTGRPIMSTTYTLFAISNDITLTLSLLVIQLLLAGYLSKSTTRVLNLAASLAAGSLLSMSFTYFAWTISISTDELLYLSYVFVYLSGGPYLVLFAISFHTSYLFKYITNFYQKNPLLISYY